MDASPTQAILRPEGPRSIDALNFSYFRFADAARRAVIEIRKLEGMGLVIFDSAAIEMWSAEDWVEADVAATIARYEGIFADGAPALVARSPAVASARTVRSQAAVERGLQSGDFAARARALMESARRADAAEQLARGGRVARG